VDNVEMVFDAAICIRVVDPMKATTQLTSGGQSSDVMRDLQSNIQERAKLALSIIIGNSTLNKKHAATKPASSATAEAVEEDFVDVPARESGGGSFRQNIHDGFMENFSAHLLDECGVLVLDMSIEDVRIVNQELAKAMASAAVANSSLEKTNIEAEIVQVKAGAEAKVAEISANGSATAMAIMAKAEAERISTVSESLSSACDPAQRQELINASAKAINKGSTIMLAQDVSALTTLLSGAQGAALVPV